MDYVHGWLTVLFVVVCSIISLAIASEKEDQTLADCLEYYRHPEQLTGENRVYCDGYCRTKTTRLTQILLQRVPPVLVFRLQRFKHTSFRGRIEKVNTPVSFPCGRDELLDITMNAFFRDEEKRVTFKLTAVCAHLGSSIDSGHYVAYVRHQDSRRDATYSDQWLRIDDEVVAVIDEAMLRKETLSSAYLLFYAQVCRWKDNHHGINIRVHPTMLSKKKTCVLVDKLTLLDSR